jgi:hypothetical protein
MYDELQTLREDTMKIEVTPLTGYSEVYTVTLAGQYRLTFAGTKDNAIQVANTLRKGINRSGRKTNPF